MSTVFDVDTIVVDGVITDTGGMPSVDIVDSSVITTVEVQVPGMQGPPGVQNVYPQSTNPAIEFGWGPEEAGFVWLKI